MMSAETITTPEWPTHPDGRNKRMGEMTREEQAAQIKASCERLRGEIESPEFAAALSIKDHR